MTPVKRGLIVGSALLGLAVGAILLLQWDPFGWRDYRYADEATLKSHPVIFVEIEYSGASAEVVAETIAAPVEQMVDGVEGCVSLVSKSSEDGKYVLQVTFQHGTNLDIAQILVQNRVMLAFPQLPNIAQDQGIIVKKKSPHVLIWITLHAKLHSMESLGKYAKNEVADNLGRIAGVAEVKIIGQSVRKVEIIPDFPKLTASNLTLMELHQKIEQQQAKDKAILGPGWLDNPIAVDENLIVKENANGKPVILKDVARLEEKTSKSEIVRLDRIPQIALAIYPVPGANRVALSEAVKQKIMELRQKLPDGMELDVAFDFSPNLDSPGQPTTPEYLQLEVQLPDGASIERTEAEMLHCEESFKNETGIKHIFSIAGKPFCDSANRGTILLQLSNEPQPDREELANRIRSRLNQQIPNASIHLYDQNGEGRCPFYGYPLEFAVSGPDPDFIRKFADSLIQELRKAPELNEVSTGLGGQSAYWEITIDSNKLRLSGIPVGDVTRTLQLFLGGKNVAINGDKVLLNREGLRNNFRLDEDLKELQVRTNQGQLVPLRLLINVGHQTRTQIVERVGLQPATRILVNPAPRVSLQEAKSICEKIIQEIGLPPETKITWLLK